MIPEQKLSELPIASELLVPVRNSVMEDYEYLPQVNRNAPSRLVRAYYDFDERAIMVNDAGAVTKVLTVPSVTRIGYAQDHNGRPTVTYVAGNETFLYWYDTSLGAMTTTSFGTTVSEPCVSFDDTRFIFLGSSDVIFSYIRGQNLYFRAQRTRYTVEYLLQPNVRKLWQTGMGKNNRFQWATY